MNQTIEKLFNAALEADEAFTAALHAEYGAKANEMRYSYEKSAETKRLGDAMSEAFDAYWEATK